MSSILALNEENEDSEVSVSLGRTLWIQKDLILPPNK